MSLTVSNDKLSLKFVLNNVRKFCRPKSKDNELIFYKTEFSFDLSTSALQVLDLPEELYHRIAHQKFKEGKGESLFYGPDNHR